MFRSPLSTFGRTQLFCGAHQPVRSCLLKRCQSFKRLHIRSQPQKSTNESNFQWHWVIGNGSKHNGRAKRFKERAVLKSATGKAIATLSLAGATGAGSYFYNELEEMFNHAVMVSERSTRIAVAAAKCFDDYRQVLGTKFDTEDGRQKALSECHKRCAERTYKVLEANAGIYIKMGQHLSAMTYLLPPEWTTTFIPLQDQCPVSSIESIRELFLKDMGVELEEIFSEFDTVPLGTASLAQVHKARIRETGDEVAVKIQHPSLAEFIPLDLKLTGLVFSAIDRFFPEYPMMWLYHELDSSIFVELDFTKEAQYAMETKAYFQDKKGLTALRIPTVKWAKPRILVMEYITGARPDDIKFLDAHNISRNEVSVCLSHIFNTMIFTPGVRVHCDPHAGNLAIRPLSKNERGPWYNRGHNFEIILYDHGLYRDVPLDLRRSYSKFWLSVIDSDEAGMRKYAKEFAGISDDQFPLFATAITGRDYHTAKSSIMTRRSKDEMKKIVAALQGGLMPSLIQLLSGVPPVVLLILKTNDLTRALDECLKSTLGPERTFLIMAQYCARTVYAEDREKLRQISIFNPKRMIGELEAFWKFFNRQSKVKFFDVTLWFTNILHL
ncbi:ABC1 family-domain-containing protein [Lipomyces tetrasporus]|uniref:ABC1 family-domain-containing protein n=1 Tax=Lipomyces tetrasporus TaxID=54092 RepID=A0AAD7QQB9_9ASCO|nr:ABC1 family-domain-containing protein [Lipomyces tetrasporus]KAJ8099363.1 ABC1 family-domain-containing protein [Lipomyces tetrasporus]